VVLSRGAIEVPDVELRDTTSSLLYPHYCSTSALEELEEGSNSLPSQLRLHSDTFADVSADSAAPEHVNLAGVSESQDKDKVYTIMGRLRTGLGESKSFFFIFHSFRS